MAMTFEHVREIFRALETGDGSAFFDYVNDDVDWTVTGTHPLAGQYHSKEAFLQGAFAKLNQSLSEGAQLIVEHLLLDGNRAAVELRSLATAKNGMRFDNHNCWIVFFEGNSIARVRAYLDSALVTRLFEENPIHSHSDG